MYFEKRAKSNSNTLNQQLQIYEQELVGRFFSTYLGWNKSVVASVFVLLYFGVLLMLHRIVGHPQPPDFGSIFKYPPASNYYYPNLIGIALDLLYHPLLFVFLLVFRNYIPLQFRKLEHAEQITARQPT
jgi:hypothetical protein